MHFDNKEKQIIATALERSIRTMLRDHPLLRMRLRQPASYSLLYGDLAPGYLLDEYRRLVTLHIKVKAELFECNSNRNTAGAARALFLNEAR